MQKYRMTGPDGRVYQVTAADEGEARKRINEAARPEGYTPGIGPRGGFGTTLENAFTLTLSDEVKGVGGGVGAAIVGALKRRSLDHVGEDYTQAYRAVADTDRAVRRQFAAEQPIASGITTLLGGLTSMRGANVRHGNAAAAAAPKGVTPGARVEAYRKGIRNAPRSATPLRDMYGAGTGLSAVAGAGASEGDLGERLKAGAQSGLTGLGITGGLHGLGAMVGGAAQTGANVLSRFGLNPEQRSLRLINRGLVDDGVDKAQMMTNYKKRGRSGETVETLAETGGPSTVGAVRALANVRGPGKAIVVDELEGRGEGLSRRVMREAARGAGVKRAGNIMDAEDALRAARSGEAVTGYRQAYATPIPQDVAQVTIVPIMRNGSPEALTSAARQLDTEALRIRSQIAQAQQKGLNVSEDEVQALTADLADVMKSKQQLQALAGGDNPNEISVRAMDYYQRGLRQMAEAAGMRTPEGSAMATARDAFNELADRVSPGFGEARTKYGEATRALEMMDLGGQLLNKSDGEVLRATRDMTKPQQDALMIGVMDQLQTKLNANDTSFVARFVKNKNWQNVMTAAIGKNPARRLTMRIRREALMRAFENAVMSGSRTTPLAEDIRALTEGEQELGFVAEAIMSGGDVKGVAMRRAVQWWQRQQQNAGIRDPRVNEAMARRLMETSTPKNIKQLYADIGKLPGYARMGATGKTTGRAFARQTPRLAPLVTQDEER